MTEDYRDVGPLRRELLQEWQRDGDGADWLSPRDVIARLDALPAATRADLSRLIAALDALDVTYLGDDEPEHEFHQGQRWMLGKVRTALARIHDSGTTPGADTWYRVDGGWRKDGHAGGSVFVEDGVLPGWDATGPGVPLHAAASEEGTDR